MKNTANRILHHPATSFLCLILAVIMEELNHGNDGLYWLFFPELIFGIVGLTTGIMNYRNKWVKRVSTCLMAVVLLSSGIGISRGDKKAAQTAAANAAGKRTATQPVSTSTPYSGSVSFGDGIYTGYSLYGYGGYTGGSTNTSTDDTKFCNFCSGTGNCHLCYGQGSHPCSCLNGKCTSCNGTGTYFSRSCLVCGGDGICDTCRGAGRTRCTWCNASGKCSECHGKGRK